MYSTKTNDPARTSGPARTSDPAGTSDPARTNDSAAIKKILADQYIAWAAGDAEAFVADYAEDATAIMPGSLRQGRDEIRQGMTASFATFLKDSTVTDEIQDIRFLGEDCAIVLSRAGILFAGEAEVPAGRFVNATWVLQRRDGTWTVESYHNSPVDPS